HLGARTPPRSRGATRCRSAPAKVEGAPRRDRGRRLGTAELEGIHGAKMNRSFACRDFHDASVSRRDLLRIGSAGMLGLSLAQLLRADSKPARKAAAQSIIFLHQWGGPAQHESFDMKPDAPAEVRNIFRPIPSTLPGVPVGELLPRTAKIMDRVCLI